MTDEDDEVKEERLKAALWYWLGQFVDEENLRNNQNATPQFIGALTEMVWMHIATTAKDLENFAKHANRTTITAADVLLLARRNEGLETLLRSFLEQRRAADGEKSEATTKSKGKGKSTGQATGRGRQSGKKNA